MDPLGVAAGFGSVPDRWSSRTVSSARSGVMTLPTAATAGTGLLPPSTTVVLERELVEVVDMGMAAERCFIDMPRGAGRVADGGAALEQRGW